MTVPPLRFTGKRPFARKSAKFFAVLVGLGWSESAEWERQSIQNSAPNWSIFFMSKYHRDLWYSPLLKESLCVDWEHLLLFCSATNEVFDWVQNCAAWTKRGQWNWRKNFAKHRNGELSVSSKTVTVIIVQWLLYQIIKKYSGQVVPQDMATTTATHVICETQMNSLVQAVSVCFQDM